jgi:hypothetical protein
MALLHDAVKFLLYAYHLYEYVAVLCTDLTSTLLASTETVCYHVWTWYDIFANCGQGSTVSIATGYRLDHPGTESRWGEICCTCPDQPVDLPSLLYNGYWVFPMGKERLGHDADPSPPSSAVVMNEYSYTSTPPVGHTACTEPQCLYKGALSHIY